MLMSESTTGTQVPVPQVPVTAPRPAIPPQGALFALGWLMAELFDPRRRESVTGRQPAFDPSVQLPQVGDLAADAKLVFLAAELTELTACYPDLGTAAAKVTAETDKKKPAGPSAPAAPAFDEAAFAAALGQLNQAILDEFADDPQRLNAYQLGLALSDLCWLPSLGAAAGGTPAAVMGLFSRGQVATLKMLLNGAGGQIPASAAAVVGKSLDNWADWLDVNAAKLQAPGAPAARVAVAALRLQGSVWHSLLIADPEVSAEPTMGAWVQAGSSIARAARMMTGTILRRFWPLIVFALIVLGALLFLVIDNLSGVSQVWASLATVAAVLGWGTYGVGSGVSRAYSGVGYEIWSAAKLEASAWNITWLPALVSTAAERTRLDSRGVAAPQIRKNLDVS